MFLFKGYYLIQIFFLLLLEQLNPLAQKINEIYMNIEPGTPWH